MPKPEYSNYFTVVIYAEFNRLEKLLELGQIYQSPIHFSRNHVREPPKSNDIVSATNEWILYGSKENKPHQHIMIKTANKYTENTFKEQIAQLIGEKVQLFDDLVPAGENTYAALSKVPSQAA